jgi:hypothetical protein
LEARHEPLGCHVPVGGFRRERVVIGRSGKELAAVIPMRDLRLLERLIEEEEDRTDVAEADRIAGNEPKSILWEDVRGDLLKGTTISRRTQATRCNCCPHPRCRDPCRSTAVTSTGDSSSRAESAGAMCRTRIATAALREVLHSERLGDVGSRADVT